MSAYRFADRCFTADESYVQNKPETSENIKERYVTGLIKGGTVLKAGVEIGNLSAYRTTGSRSILLQIREATWNTP